MKTKAKKIQDMQNLLDDIKSDLKEIDGKLSDILESKEEVILVPDNIGIWGGNGYNSMGICFGKNQILLYNYGMSAWHVVAGGEDFNKYKLTPCKREDLVAGDIGYNRHFLSEAQSGRFDILGMYRLVISKNLTIQINQSYDTPYPYPSADDAGDWYKVEPLK